VSDPAVGGTYMTLLNTVTNLGGNWPSTLALWMVDPLTTKLCQGGNSTVTSCGDTVEMDLCTGGGGACHTETDGYYIEIWVGFLLGMTWLVLWGWRTITMLQDAPDSAWTVVRQKEKQ
jgi:PAT family acetyl-CoA transporter-like MFS transporter 1